MTRPSPARDAAAVGLMVAVIEVCKLVMQGLPNIEMTSFLLILFTLHFGRLSIYAVPAFILIEGMIYGFGLWWVMYLYAWPLLTLVTRAFSRQDSAFFWAFVSGAFGLLFGLLCAPVYLFSGGPGFAVSWWISGIPFDLTHAAGNFVIALVLFVPLRRLLTKLYANIQ